MNERFFPLANGTLINMFAVQIAEPSSETNKDGSKTSVLSLLIHGQHHVVKGPDADKLYAALTMDGTSTASILETAPAPPPAA